MSLREKTVQGISWNAFGNIVTMGVQFVIGVILANLLTPNVYGLIGMVGIFIAVAQSLMDSGLSAALVRKPECSEQEFSTAFFFKIGISAFLYVVLFVTAPLISTYFGEPELVGITRVVCLNFIILSVSQIHRTILVKKLEFKKLMKIKIISIVGSGTVGITMACLGFGVWSLVYQSLFQAILSSGLLLLLGAWRPTQRFSYKTFKELFGFGSKLLLSNLLNTIHNNIYNLVIAKYFSVSDLGLYSRGKRLTTMFGMNAFSAIQSVTYPVLSSIGDDLNRLRNSYRKLLAVSGTIGFFLLLLLAACGNSLINGLLGEKWAGSIPYLQLLCLSEIFYPISSINLNILKVRGRSDIFLKVELIKKVFVIPAVIIGIKYGILNMLVIVAISSLIAYFINAWYSGKLVSYGIQEQVKDLYPGLMLALSVAIPVYIVGTLMTQEPIVVFLVQLALGSMGTLIVFKKSKYYGIVELRLIFEQQVVRLRSKTSDRK